MLVTLNESGGVPFSIRKFTGVLGGTTIAVAGGVRSVQTMRYEFGWVAGS